MLYSLAVICIFEPPHSNNFGVLVKQIHETLERSMNQELEAFNLTGSQLSVLLFLQSRGEEKTSIRDIQRHLMCAHPTAIGLVKRLEKKGFVQTIIDPNDKRARIVCLEHSFLSEFLANTHDVSEMDEIVMKGLSREERDQLCSLLQRVYLNIKS